VKRKELLNLLAVVIATAIFSFVIASFLFGSQSKRGTAVPVVQPISSTLPDIQNDPNYSFIFNNKALDPTQPIQIGTSQNNTPFNNGQ
jgi:hypothetical protein